MEPLGLNFSIPAAALKHGVSAPPDPNVIGGWTIGQAGPSGIYTSYTLAGGDDFTSLDIVGPVTPNARWFSTGAYHAATIRNNTTSLGMSYDADPLTTGHADKNKGVPVGFPNMSRISSSVIRLLTRQATAGEQAYFSPTDPSINGGVRPLISAMIHSAGCFAYFNTTVPVLVSLKMRLSSKTTNPGGSHMSAWDYCATPPTATVGNERDIECTSQGLYHENIPHGTPGSNLSNGSYDYLDGQFHIFDFVFVNGSSHKLYVDGVLKSSLATDAQTAGTPNHFILSNHVVNGFNSDVLDYPGWAASATGAYMDIDWIRFAYDTAAGRSWKPLQTIADVNVDYAGTASIVLPTPLALFGDATAVLNVQVMPYDYAEPGMTLTTAFSTLPAGWTYNAGTRTISIDYSATGGNAGRSHVVVYGYKTDTGFVAQPARFAVNRGPNITATLLEPVPDGAGGLVCDVYYAADVGYLFASTSPKKVYSFTGLPAGWSYDANTYKLSCATPAAAGGTVNMTITNGVGQTQTKAIDLWSPAAMGSVFAWDTTVPASVPAGGSAVIDLYDLTKQIFQTTSGNRPLVITTGGIGGNKRTLSYISNGISIRSDDAGATNASTITSFADTADVRTGDRYVVFACDNNSVGNVNRPLGWFNTAGTQFMGFRYTTTGGGPTIQGAGGAQQAADQTGQDSVMHVMEIVKTGASYVFRVDGTQVGTVTITQTGGIAANLFILGGSQAGGAFIGQFGPGFFTKTIPSAADQLRARQWVASRMGITTA